ncbi:glucosyltransferase domain-containing protein [Enterobacter soli]
MTCQFIKNDDYRKSFSLTLAFFLMYLFPIILIGRYYIDDMGRSIYGYAGWGQDGRPLADLIMRVFSIGEPIIDLSPLNQFVSIVLLAASVTLYVYKNATIKNWFATGIISSLFICSPFIIENLSYKFDSLTMLLSAAILFIPFCLEKTTTTSYVASVTAIICSLSLYQAAIGIFAILTVIDVVLKSDKSAKEDLINILTRVSQLVVGYIAYKYLISKISDIGSYGNSHAKLITSSDHIKDSLIFNINQIAIIFKQAINPYPAIILSAIALLMAYCIVCECCRAIRSHGSVNILKISVIVISPTLVVIFSFIHLLALEKPVLAPRVFISTGCVLIFIGVLLHRNLSNRLSAVITLLALLFGLVNVFGYSNVSKAQDKLDSIYSSSIRENVSAHNHIFKVAVITGTMPVARQRDSLGVNFPLLARMVPVYMNADWAWGARLLDMNGLQVNYSVFSEDDAKLICNSIPFYKSTDYELFDAGERLIIRFKSNGHKC